MFRSDEQLDHMFLPNRYDGYRDFYTSIYFLLKRGQISRLHRLLSDELWYFHHGLSLAVHSINVSGKYTAFELGPNPEYNETLQIQIPRNSWFCAETLEGEQDYSLVSCVVAPGFQFQDFELGKRDDLLNTYPEHEELIKRFC